MADDVKISETKLLYDPLFAKKPDVDMKGKKYRPFKIAFVIIITIFVGISLYFSFNSISSDKYVYKDKDDGWQLYQFNGGTDDTTLHIDYVRDDNGEVDTSETVVHVREFAMSCNEYVQFIFIGKDVKTLEDHCFYYTRNLKAVIVDPDNPYFTSVDGVLYNKDMTEIILCPINNYQYRCALAAGLAAPTDEKSAKQFITDFDEKYGEEPTDDNTEYLKQFADYTTYDIPAGVTTIATSCFSDCAQMTEITIPDGVKEIGSLAFFKCTKLEKIHIPDGVETIGSDAFSYIYNSAAEDENSDAKTVTYIFVPESVRTIGHHAFYGDLGCEHIWLAAESEDDVETGDHWLPKQSARSMKDVEPLYGQERSEG